MYNAFVKLNQKTAFERLALLGRAAIPIFYEGGIIAARLGGYHLARMENDKRILLFATDLEHLQKKEYPDGSVFFAHPERLFAVGAYESHAPTGKIYADMVSHQEQFRDTIHQEGTLVRMGPGVYQSRHVSFLETPDKNDPKKVHVYAFVSGLPSETFVPVQHDYVLGTHLLNQRRFHLTPGGSIEKDSALPLIISHYTELQDGLAHGVPAISTESNRLPRPSRILLGILFGAVGLFSRLKKNTFDQLNESLEEIQYGNGQPMYDFVQKAASYMSLQAYAKAGLSKMARPALEVLLNFRNDAKINHRELPNGLGRYGLPQPVQTPLNAHLIPLRDTATTDLQPTDARAAQIFPLNYKSISVDPFDAKRFEHIGWNTYRSSFGSVLFIYDKTSLIFQPNGLWIAAVYDKEGDGRIRNETIVGYYPKIDKSSRPAPLPAVAEYLAEGSVIVFTHDAANEQSYSSSLVPLANLRHELAEIYDAGDGDLLVAKKPAVRQMSEIVRRDVPAMGSAHMAEILKRRGDTLAAKVANGG